MIILVMGVSGCGKTTVGRLLAHRLDACFVEGDDLHSPANIAKMASGTPLDDADRWDWLDAVGAAAGAEHLRGGTVIVACSALRRVYRERLAAGMGERPRLIFLRGGFPLLSGRMHGRRGHFMPLSLLRSQLATLEEPQADEGAIIIDVALPPGRVVDRAVSALQSHGVDESPSELA